MIVTCPVSVQTEYDCDYLCYVKHLTADCVHTMLSHLLCNHLLFHIFLHIILHSFEIWFLINYRLWYEGAPKYMGESVKDTKSWIWKIWNGWCMVGKGDSSGMLADVQASQHDSTVHVQRVFPPKVQKLMIVMSFGDTTNVLLMYIGGRNKRQCTRDWGYLVWFESLVQLFWLVPQLIFWEATDPLIQLAGCLSRSGTITRVGSVFYLFNCTYSRLSWVPWVGVL